MQLTLFTILDEEASFARGCLDPCTLLRCRTRTGGRARTGRALHRRAERRPGSLRRRRLRARDLRRRPRPRARGDDRPLVAPGLVGDRLHDREVPGRRVSRLPRDPPPAYAGDRGERPHTHTEVTEAPLRRWGGRERPEPEDGTLLHRVPAPIRGSRRRRGDAADLRARPGLRRDRALIRHAVGARRRHGRSMAAPQSVVPRREALGDRDRVRRARGLLGPGGGADSRGEVDGLASVAVRAAVLLEARARVRADPHVGGDDLRIEGALDRDRRLDRRPRGDEDGEEPVAGLLCDLTAELDDLLADDGIVPGQELLPLLVPERLQELRRPDDVGEEERARRLLPAEELSGSLRVAPGADPLERSQSGLELLLGGVLVALPAEGEREQ